MLSKHLPQKEQHAGFKDSLSITLDEAMTALEESFRDLTDDQLQRFPISGRNNIAWIVMHCLSHLSEYAGFIQTGQRDIPYERRWYLWQCSPEERPKPGDAFPSRDQMLGLLERVHATAEAGLEAATEEDLHTRRFAEHWWKRTAADAYLRTVCHTQAHVRQIWLLRGALGLTDGRSWPQQHGG
jgi:hypothetical protein